jgi:diguanylate cyclase (GGDEF)-like protein
MTTDKPLNLKPNAPLNAPISKTAPWRVLIVDLDEKQAFEFVDNSRATLAEHPVDIQNEKLTIMVSVGVTTVLGDYIDTMISQADALLYQAKQNGQNCVVVV